MKDQADLLIFASSLAFITLGWTMRSHTAAAAEEVCRFRTQSRICYSTGHYPLLASGQVVRSMLNITKPMRFGDLVWNDAHVPDGPVWVRIDLHRQLLSVFRDGREIGSSVIVYGSDGKPTPTGRFFILEKDADHHSHTYGDAPMPYMLRLTEDGVALHGSVVRAGWVTHDCIGVPLEFARLLFGAANKGDLVVSVPPA